MLLDRLTPFPLFALPDFNEPLLVTTDSMELVVEIMPSRQVDNSKALDYCTLLMTLHTEEAEVPSDGKGALRCVA